MTHATAPAMPPSSRLVHYLHQMAVADAGISHKNFVDKLGRLIDLSDSITLSEALRGLARTAFESTAPASSSPREEFLRQRTEMLEFIARSFVTDTSALPFRLPRASEETLNDEAAGFQPYQRFYALHQSEMEFRLVKLRLQVRQAVAAHSHQLAQLAALDTALGDTLAVHSRKLLAAIPRLLGRRFQFLRQQYRQTLNNPSQTADDPAQWTRPGGWLVEFHTEMQGLLLAELDLRLQPVLGLIEAFDAEAGTRL